MSYGVAQNQRLSNTLLPGYMVVMADVYVCPQNYHLFLQTITKVTFETSAIKNNTLSIGRTCSSRILALCHHLEMVIQLL